MYIDYLKIIKDLYPFWLEMQIKCYIIEPLHDKTITGQLYRHYREPVATSIMKRGIYK